VVVPPVPKPDRRRVQIALRQASVGLSAPAGGPGPLKKSVSGIVSRETRTPSDEGPGRCMMSRICPVGSRVFCAKGAPFWKNRSRVP
jgi:hypothetical protein